MSLDMSLRHYEEDEEREAEEEREFANIRESADESELEKIGEEFVGIMQNFSLPHRKRKALEFFNSLDKEGQDYIRENHKDYLKEASFQF